MYCQPQLTQREKATMNRRILENVEKAWYISKYIIVQDSINPNHQFSFSSYSVTSLGKLLGQALKESFPAFRKQNDQDTTFNT